jgi:PPM family protein phosphatase
MSDAMRYAAATDTGRRRETNEDFFQIKPPLFVIADGLGGHKAGDVAARMAVEVFDEHFAGEGGGTGGLRGAVVAANRAVFEKASTEPGLTGMGTTLTAMVAGEGSVQIAHVGDSRAYLLRGGELEQITRDQTVVERLVRQGQLAPEEVESHPRRSMLEKAVGVEPQVEPDLYVVDIEPGDRMLLCTDGLTGMVAEEEIAEILEGEEDPEKACEKLVKAALSAGGTDNVTALVVDMPGPRPPARVRPSRVKRAVRTRWKAAAVAVVVLAVVAGGLPAIRHALASSWFVGTSDGKVAVFRGSPDSILGMKVRKVEKDTDVPVAALPEIYRERLAQGIKAKDLSDAEGIVRSMRELAAAPRSPPPSPPSGGASPSP